MADTQARLTPRSRAELDEGIDALREAPAEAGSLELIVRRPGAMGERELLTEGELDTETGLAGDRWLAVESRRPRAAQLTIMSVRAAALITGGADHVRWAEAGDQLYVDLDISRENLPAGSRVAIGDAVVEITAGPHTGCGKFSRRFGVDALKFVNTKLGRELRLRGVNARVTEPGSVRIGDRVSRLAATD